MCSQTAGDEDSLMETGKGNYESLTDVSIQCTSYIFMNESSSHWSIHHHGPGAIFTINKRAQEYSNTW